MAATEVEAGEGGGPVVRLTALDEEEEVIFLIHHHHHLTYQHHHHRNHPGPLQAMWLQTSMWLRETMHIHGAQGFFYQHSVDPLYLILPRGDIHTRSHPSHFSTTILHLSDMAF